VGTSAQQRSRAEEQKERIERIGAEREADLEQLDLLAKDERKQFEADKAVEGQIGDFRIGDLERLCPHVSRDMVRVVLRQLRVAGVVACLGHGPGAIWRRKAAVARRRGNTSKKG
jgi:myo-inositol catabolism protein IolC